MKESMTPRERMRCAMTGGTPDRVPVAPDISTMIPCKKSGCSFIDVLLRRKPQLWQAYLEAVKYYGIDGWFAYGDIGFEYKKEYTERYEEYYDDQNRLVVRRIVDTPKGQLTSATMYPENDCDVPVEKLIKDFKEDFPKFKYLFPEITGYNDEAFRHQEKELGDLGIMAVGIYPPGMHMFNNYFQGGLETVTYAYYDEPELFMELNEMYARWILKQSEIIAEIKPESVLTGGSGSITMQSPSIWEELTLPTLKKMISLFNEAGIITGVHSCGKEMHLIKTLSQETELDYINPLELAPAGDCDLAEVKKLYGKDIAIMGNLHTTNTMLNGSVETIRKESLKAIRDAGVGGGFILSTGDQTPRDTPDENIFEMVNIVKEFGSYPLNMDKIEVEIAKYD